jgi:hypothetical protein
MCGSRPLAGGGHGIGRHGRVGVEIVLRAIGRDVLRDGVVQLLRGRALVHDQTAIGLVVEQDLRDAEHDQRIKPAADDGEHQRGPSPRPRISENNFFISLNEFEGGDEQVNEP